jgi:mRNA interferase RelE/StbE
LSYEIRPRRVVQKGLDDLPQRDYEIIAKVISTLEENPRPPRVKKLADSGLWRIRVGKYRIVYAVEDKTKVVTLVRVAVAKRILTRA